MQLEQQQQKNLQQEDHEALVAQLSLTSTV